MALKKQEFYEGAALYVLARKGSIRSILYQQPFFLINETVCVLLKYSTKVRSPWNFTFTPDERTQLQGKAGAVSVVIGLICGSDGVAAIHYPLLEQIIGAGRAAVNVSCFRQHGEHYEVSGPHGILAKKISPSSWTKILERALANEAR